MLARTSNLTLSSPTTFLSKSNTYNVSIILQYIIDQEMNFDIDIECTLKSEKFHLDDRDINLLLESLNTTASYIV